MDVDRVAVVETVVDGVVVDLAGLLFCQIVINYVNL